MEKLYSSKHVLKLSVGVHSPHPSGFAPAHNGTDSNVSYPVATLAFYGYSGST